MVPGLERLFRRQVFATTFRKSSMTCSHFNRSSRAVSRRLARAWGLRPTEWVAELRLARMGEWLADLLKGKYKEEKEIHLGTPLLPLNAIWL